MAQVAGPKDGWKILHALGIPESRITKAVITMEVGCQIKVECTHLGEPVEGTDELEVFRTAYDLVPKDEQSGFVTAN